MTIQEEELLKALKMYYGTIKDPVCLLDAIGAVVAATKFAGVVGSNPLCVLNRTIETLIKERSHP